MKVAVIGSRSIREFDINAIIMNLPARTDTIVSGGAMGADALAERTAREKSLPLIKIMPDYKRYGHKAPLVRNREIVVKADFVLAIWDFKSRGTAHVIAECIRSGVPCKILSPF